MSFNKIEAVTVNCRKCGEPFEGELGWPGVALPDTRYQAIFPDLESAQAEIGPCGWNIDGPLCSFCTTPFDLTRETHADGAYLKDGDFPKVTTPDEKRITRLKATIKRLETERANEAQHRHQAWKDLIDVRAQLSAALKSLKEANERIGDLELLIAQLVTF